MSRTKAHWRRLSVWVDSFKQMGEGWAYLQTWHNPPATIGTMAGMTALCCYPHITISLAATALVIYMVRPGFQLHADGNSAIPPSLGESQTPLLHFAELQKQTVARHVGASSMKHAC